MSGVYVTIEEIERRLGDAANKSGRVIANAANRAMITGEKVIKQETAAKYNVRQKDVASTLKKIKAKWSEPTARLEYTGGHGNLFYFGRADQSVLKPRYPVRSTSPYDPDPGNVFVRIMKDGSMVPLEQDPKPFVQIVSGNLGLFQRTSSASDAPLRGEAPPSIPQIIRNEKVMERFQKESWETMQKRLEHELDRIMKGY